MRLFDAIFNDHPASVGETYFEHLLMAGGFSMRMIGAGLACLVHALLPCLFVRTGSRQIMMLHERMVSGRMRAKAGASAQPLLDYHI